MGNPQSIGVPQGTDSTAQTNQGSGPSLGVLQEAKLGYAPDVNTAIKYLKSLPGYNKDWAITSKTDDNGKPILKSISDIYMIPAKSMSDENNDYIDALGTQVGPGILGSLVHGAPVAIGQTLGGIGGAAGAGYLTKNPTAALAGGVLGAGMGSGVGDLINQAIGHQLYPGSNQDMNYKQAGIQGAFGAATDLPFRAGGPIIAKLFPQTSTNLGEDLARLGPKQETAPIGGNTINVSKLMAGTPDMEAAEVSKINAPFKNTINSESELLQNKLANTKNSPLNDVGDAATQAGPLGEQGAKRNKGVLTGFAAAEREDYSGEPLQPQDMANTQAIGPNGHQYTVEDWENLKTENPGQYEAYSNKAREAQRNLGTDKSSQIIKGAEDDYSQGKNEVLQQLRNEYPREYPDTMSDAEMTDLLGEPVHLERAIQSVNNRFSGGRASGLSYEDVMNMKPKQLIFLNEFAAKRGRTGFLSDEGAKSLSDMTQQLGDLQAKMAREKRFMPRPGTPEASQLGYFAPQAYSTRGGELLGTATNAGIPWALNVGNQAINPSTYATTNKQQAWDRLQKKLGDK